MGAAQVFVSDLASDAALQTQTQTPGNKTEPEKTSDAAKSVKELKSITCEAATQGYVVGKLVKEKGEGGSIFMITKIAKEKAFLTQCTQEEDHPEKRELELEEMVKGYKPFGGKIQTVVPSCESIEVHAEWAMKNALSCIDIAMRAAVTEAGSNLKHFTLLTSPNGVKLKRDFKKHELELVFASLSIGATSRSGSIGIGNIKIPGMQGIVE